MTKEDAIKVLSESIHDGSKVPWDKIVEAVHLSIESLSGPSLPSNLDEVANNYGRNIRLGYPRVMDETDKYICNAFKAGAEWMAEQGETFETEISNIGMLQLPKINIQSGDKVIIQIRKKKEDGKLER